MERYDAKSKCPKCDNDIVGTEFHGRSFEEEGCSTLLCEFPGQEEHIVRTCAKCGFEFFQKPIDRADGATDRASSLRTGQSVSGDQGTNILLEEPTEIW